VDNAKEEYERGIRILLCRFSIVDLRTGANLVLSVRDLRTGIYNFTILKPANAVEARVLRISIVCRDVDGTSKLWAKALSLPVPEILTADPDPRSFLDFRSTVSKATFKRAIIQLENAQLELLQPVGNVASPETEYLEKHPAGVRRVLFAITDPNAPERFAKLGLTKRTQGGRELYIESSAGTLNVPTEWVIAKDHNALDEIGGTDRGEGGNTASCFVGRHATSFTNWYCSSRD